MALQWNVAVSSEQQKSQFVSGPKPGFHIRQTSSFSSHLRQATTPHFGAKNVSQNLLQYWSSPLALFTWFSIEVIVDYAAALFSLFDSKDVLACAVHWQAFEGHLPFRRRGLVQCKAKKRKEKARLTDCEGVFRHLMSLGSTGFLLGCKHPFVLISKTVKIHCSGVWMHFFASLFNPCLSISNAKNLGHFFLINILTFLTDTIVSLIFDADILWKISPQY